MQLYLTLTFTLFAAHAFTDWACQSEFMAIYKSQKSEPLKNLGIKGTIWPWVLLAHVLINAGGVLVVTGNIWLALIELAIHTVIDYSKNAGYFGFVTDQALHLACKLVYVLLIWQGIFAFNSWLPIH